MRVWGFLFSSLRFLEKLCLVCSFRFHKTHPSLTLKISLSFLPLFSKKLNSPPSRSVLAWPLFDQNGDTRDTNIWSAREYRHSHTQKHIYSINIMFAATQQIASIAGLKATKVQVRFTSSSLLFDLYYPSSSSSSSSRWGGGWRWEMMNIIVENV